MSLRSTKDAAPTRLPPMATLSADGATAALHVSPMGNGVALLCSADLSAMWDDYSVLWWTFGGAVPPQPVRTRDPKAILVKLAKLVLRNKRLDRPKGTVVFKDKDTSNLRRDNITTVAPYRSSAEVASRASAVAAGLRRMGFIRAPRQEDGAELPVS